MRSTEILYLLTTLFSSNFVCIQMQGTRSGSHAMKILQHDKILKFPSVIYLFFTNHLISPLRRRQAVVFITLSSVTVSGFTSAAR